MNIIDRIKDALKRFREAMGETRRSSSRYVRIATDINFGRYLLMVVLATPIIAGTMIAVSRVDAAGDALVALWRSQILIVDAVMIACHLILLGMLALLRKLGKVKVVIVAQYIGVALIVALSGANTVIGQYISPNISVFIYACVLAGFVFYLRPAVSFIAFYSVFLFMFFALPLTQGDHVLLASARMNVFATVSLGWFVSVVGWINLLAKNRRTAIIAAQTLELQELSRRDRLSGLLNRGAMEDALRDAYVAQKEGVKPIPIFILDLDEFKLVNDSYGHPAGDGLIRKIARVLTENVPNTALISRWGGDEFLVACPGCELAGIKGLAEKIRDIIATTAFSIDENLIRTSVSIGVSIIDETFDRGYRDADKALYLAKRSGKNRVMTIEDLK
ncbi:MAG: GGDEF domain-containing protein [Bacillota bacterium]|nr:GGDEF domain-containing protein [Bacillota bacterium]